MAAPEVTQPLGAPGNAQQAITVGASTKTAPIMVTGYSSRGTPRYPGKPDLVAPGENIMAPQPGKQYDSMSGTSMAAPHVTGLVALLYQAMRYVRRKKRPTPAEIKQWLKQGCRDLGESSLAQGSGLVNFDSTMKTFHQTPKRSWIPKRTKKKTTKSES